MFHLREFAATDNYMFHLFLFAYVLASSSVELLSHLSFFLFCAIEDMNQIELDPRTMTKEGLTQFKQVSKYYMWILDSIGLVNRCNGNYR